jgi:hypothetical protein
MQLKEYNKVQSQILNEEGALKLALSQSIKDIIEFKQICSLLAYLRGEDNTESVRWVMRLIVKEELEWYQNNCAMQYINDN